MNWLILRGLIRESRHWGEFTPIFQQKIGTDGIVATLDYPGFGTEFHRESPDSIEKIMLDVRARFLQLKSTNHKPWSIMAISLGGMVLMKWAELFPEDFDQWIIVNSSAKGLSPLHHRFTPKNWPMVFQQLLNRDVEKREQKILKMTTNLSPEGIKKRAHEQAKMYRERPFKKSSGLKQIFAALKFSAPPHLKIKGAVIVARGDTLVSPKCSEKIAERYNLPLFEHPSANHDLSTDDPAWLAETLSKFCHR